MSILFGTDGIRGQVGIYPITPEFFFEFGKVIAEVFRHYHNEGESPQFLIGKDTRISSDMLETALISGVTNMGCNVICIGYAPTPAVAYLTQKLELSAGLMITASHNLFQDNGIKLFDHKGYKISDKIQDHIEKLLITRATSGIVVNNGLYGRIIDHQDAIKQYKQLLLSHFQGKTLKGIKIVLDCANGVASTIAPEIFTSLEAQLIIIGNTPNGTNINQNIGATYPEILVQEVIKQQAHFGIALDGDADRVIFVNGKGQIINGDKILALAAIALKEENALNHNTLVLTQMSNLGVINSLKNHYDIQVTSTLIGDRHVMEEMRRHKYSLGGENSGHIIFDKVASTGDGILSALKITTYILFNKKKAANILKSLEIYPYKLLNIQVNSKPPIETLPNVSKVLIQCEKDLENEGRYLLRYSGTEDKIRILVEAKDTVKVTKWINKIAEVVKQDIG